MTARLTPRPRPLATPPPLDTSPVRDVLDRIPRRHRLSTRLLVMAVVLAVAALGGVWAAERRITRDFTAQAERSASLLAQAVQTATQEAMERAQPSHAYDQLGRVAHLDGITSVRVVNKEGRVVFSTDPAQLGKVASKAEGTCLACHATDTPRSQAPIPDRSRYVETRDGRVLRFASAIYNAPSCATAECHAHPQGRQVLGVLELGVSMAPVDRDVIVFRSGFMALVSFGIVLLAIALYLYGRSEIIEPVAALLEGTHRVGRDELDLEIRVRSKGELGVLAMSFNDMTRSLRRLEDELRLLMQHLEEQVDERTAELKAAQSVLVRTEKLSSLGKLSASIAHEINNPLAGILTFAKLVSRTLAEGPPDGPGLAKLQKNLSLVEREAQRCSAIVKSLLDFARERPIARKEVDVNAVIDEALSLVGHQVALQGVALERDLAPLPPIVADFGQLRQAIVNVAMNACEAMGGAPGAKLLVRSRPAGLEILIQIADNGPGIPPERLQKIFDPFFTTKEKGTGLGLSVVYGIIERHGGKVEVDSAVGQGTAFTFRLPLAGPPAPPEAPAQG
ncbi:MAG: ATP-binding protein [Anaeromyxobacter sp.]